MIEIKREENRGVFCFVFVVGDMCQFRLDGLKTTATQIMIDFLIIERTILNT